MSDGKKCQVGERIEVVGGGIAVRHREGCAIDYGVMTPLRDGQPIPEVPGGVVCRQLEDGSYEPVYESRGSSSGPAQVATEAYRGGWDRIFGKPPVVGQA